MKQEELNKKAIDIINTNIYLSLSTTDGSIPWIAPLAYCVDKSFNFYFISQMDSVHITNILKQPKVAFAIFDSHQPEGSGNGVQGDGIVSLLRDNEIIEWLKYYSTSLIDLKPELLVEPAPYRLFKLSVNNFFILDPDAKIDKRIKVFIKK